MRGFWKQTQCTTIHSCRSNIPITQFCWTSARSSSRFREPPQPQDALSTGAQPQDALCHVKVTASGAQTRTPRRHPLLGRSGSGTPGSCPCMLPQPSAATHASLPPAQLLTHTPRESAANRSLTSACSKHQAKSWVSRRQTVTKRTALGRPASGSALAACP